MILINFSQTVKGPSTNRQSVLKPMELQSVAGKIRFSAHALHHRESDGDSDEFDWGHVTGLLLLPWCLVLTPGRDADVLFDHLTVMRLKPLMWAYKVKRP